MHVCVMPRHAMAGAGGTWPPARGPACACACALTSASLAVPLAPTASSAPAPCSPQIDLENQLEAEQEYILNKLQKQVDKLAGEKGALAKEKSDLQRQITDLGASVERLNRDKVVLEQQMEMEEENIGACAPRLSILEHGGLWPIVKGCSGP